ncbi:MAG: glycosyltransferase family 4 protein [Flavobacteriales bacterium]
MKKSICFIVSSPFTVKSFLVNHIKALSEFYDVSVIANFENIDHDLLKDLPLSELKHIPISRSINVLKDFKTLMELVKYLKRKNFNAIHTVTPKAGLIGTTAGRLAKIKLRTHIFTGQVWHTKQGVFKVLLKFIDKIIVSNSTDILVDGESQRKFLIKNNIVKESNSSVLGRGSISGVDTKRFIPNELIKVELKSELNFDAKDIVLMFLGRLNTDKGIVELVDAFQKMNRPHVKLLFVGSDEENIEMKIKSKYSDTTSIKFYGPTPSPEKLLQVCDIFCLPSHREGFGTSIIEASLLEKPILCSDTYGLMETILDNQTGLRHKVNDVDSIISKMKLLVNNPELRRKLGVNGREYVLNNFRAEQITEEWLNYYKNNL